MYVHQNQRTFIPNCRSPKRKIPRKADSRKKVKAPSIASVWAMMSPAEAKKKAQLAAKLKLHWDTGGYRHHEGHGADLPLEPGSLVAGLAAPV